MSRFHTIFTQARSCPVIGVVHLPALPGAAIDGNGLERVREKVQSPLIIGSGVTPDTVRDCAGMADGLIVGSALKRDGYAGNAVDAERVAALMNAMD